MNISPEYLNDYMTNSTLFNVAEVNDSTVLSKSKIYSDGSRISEHSHHWLQFKNNVTVAFAHVEAINNTVVLRAIEVRDTYRGIGLGREFLAILETLFKDRIYSDGRFTASGLRSFPELETLPQNEKIIIHPAIFVRDWNNFLAMTEL